MIAAVIEKKKAGVDVQVMLNAQRSGGDRANDETFEQFRNAGVAVQWANPKFYVTHEKSIVVDEKAALVATFNLTEKYLSLTREYGVITYHPHQVRQIVEVFKADWNHLDWDCSAWEGLLWSNSNSRYHMAQFIDQAEHRLDVQHPKFVDAVILERLAAASDRGVKVRVLCGGKHGISEWDILDTFASLRTLRRFGAKVHKQKNLRVHAKLIIVDEAKALVGSMNIDRSAFDLRRELGIMTDDARQPAEADLRIRLEPVAPLRQHRTRWNRHITTRTTSRMTKTSFTSERGRSGPGEGLPVRAGVDVQSHCTRVVRRRVVRVVAGSAGRRRRNLGCAPLWRRGSRR